MSPSPDHPPVLSGRTFRGFGTTIGSWTTEVALVGRLDAFLQSWVSRVEAACSRFDPGSDLSRANVAAGAAVRVAPELLGATRAALALAELTGGLCDPTIGEAVIAAGYDRDFDALVATGAGPRGPAQPGGAWRQLAVDVEAATVTVPAGRRLDLGGSAKGWAVDVALQTARRSMLPLHPEAGVCIGAGGDLAVTGRPPVGGWPVTICERLAPAAPSAGADPGARPLEGVEVRLLRGAMATSGATARRWRLGRGHGHHVIDPRTGRPGRSRWRLVTVFADSCAVADAAATAAWLLDGEARGWLQRCGLAARLVDGRGRVTLAGDVARWATLSPSPETGRPAPW